MIYLKCWKGKKKIILYSIKLLFKNEDIKHSEINAESSLPVDLPYNKSKGS